MIGYFFKVLISFPLPFGSNRYKYSDLLRDVKAIAPILFFRRRRHARSITVRRPRARKISREDGANRSIWSRAVR